MKGANVNTYTSLSFKTSGGFQVVCFSCSMGMIIEAEFSLKFRAKTAKNVFETSFKE
jgi:hypothetical protein